MLEDKHYIDLTATKGGGGEGGVTDHADLTGRSKSSQHPISAITDLQAALDAKQDTISDLEDIRSGAEKGSTSLQTSNIGQFVSLGFDGTLASGVLTFMPPEGQEAYTITENHMYELDLSFQVSGTVDDTVQVEIDNDGEDMPIQFYAVTHNDVTTSITWADFKKLATYDDTNGYRWFLYVSYHVTSSGVPCFVMYPTINKQTTETFTFTLSDGTEVAKNIVIGD